MSASPWILYNEMREHISDGTVDLNDDTFKVALLDSTSNAADVTIEGYAALTGELPTLNGYTLGGITLSGVTWVKSAATVVFDAADPGVTATGGILTMRYIVMYSDTSVGKVLIAHSLLDITPADVVIPDGVTQTFNIAATGVFVAG